MKGSALDGGGMRDPIKAASLRLRPLKTTEPSGGLKLSPAENEPTSPLSPTSRTFSLPELNVVILCIVGLAEKPSLHHIQEFLRSTLVKHMRFHSIQKSGGSFHPPEWHPVEVDLSQHVFEHPSEVGPSNTSEDPAEAFTAQLATAPPLDKHYPLWQAHILKHPKGARRPASLVLRFHHSLGDGISLMSLLMAATRQAENPNQLPSVPGQTPKPPLSPKPMLQRLLAALLMFLLIFWDSVVLIWRMIALAVVVEDSDTPIKAQEGMQHRARALASSREIDLADVKAVAKAVGGGATVNDVLIASVAGGLNRYFKAQDTDTDTDTETARSVLDNASPKQRGGKLHSNGLTGVQTKGWHAPKKLLVRALSMVNIRKAPGVQELDGMMRGGSQARWGNEVGYVMLPLPVNEVSDPLDRVRAVRRETRMAKNSIEAWYTACNGSLMVTALGPSVAFKATKRSILHTTLSVSNVVGPGEAVTMAGIRVTDLIPTAVGLSQGLMMHLVSYDNKVKFVASSIKEVIPNPADLCQKCVDAFEDILRSRVQTKRSLG